MLRIAQLFSLAVLFTSMVVADVLIQTYTSQDCTGSDLAFMISSGAGVVQTQPFQSFRTTTISGNDIVTVCAQGFSCAEANLNAAAGLQACVRAPSGSFDKIDDEKAV